MSCPIYFSKRPLKSRNFILKKGDLFPFQDKAFIRGLATNFEVKGGDSVPFGDLPYVEAVDVGTLELQRRILAGNLNSAQVHALLEGGNGAV